MALDLSWVSEGTDSHLISATHSLSTEDDPLDPHSEYVPALCRANSDQETSERTKVAQCESCSGQIQTAPGIIAWVQLPWRKARKLSKPGDDCRLTRRPLVRALFVSHLLPVWTRELFPRPSARGLSQILAYVFLSARNFLTSFYHWKMIGNSKLAWHQFSHLADMNPFSIIAGL
jgi:hypothetical protein